MKEYPSARVVDQNRNLTFGENPSYRLTQFLFGYVSGIKYFLGERKIGFLEFQVGFGVPFNTNKISRSISSLPREAKSDTYGGLRFGFAFGNKPLFQKEDNNSSKIILYRSNSN